jgi:hypothetical protein
VRDREPRALKVPDGDATGAESRKDEESTMTDASPPDQLAIARQEAEDFEQARAIEAGEIPSDEVMDIAEAFDVIGIDPQTMTPGTMALGSAAWAARDLLVGTQPANDDVAIGLSV